MLSGTAKDALCPVWVCSDTVVMGHNGYVVNGDCEDDEEVAPASERTRHDL